MDLLEKLDPKLLEQLQSVTQIGEGDRLVFQFHYQLTREQALQFKDMIKAALGDDLRFLITGKDIGTYVIRAEN